MLFAVDICFLMPDCRRDEEQRLKEAELAEREAILHAKMEKLKVARMREKQRQAETLEVLEQAQHERELAEQAEQDAMERQMELEDRARALEKRRRREERQRMEEEERERMEQEAYAAEMQARNRVEERSRRHRDRGGYDIGGSPAYTMPSSYASRPSAAQQAAMR